MKQSVPTDPSQLRPFVESDPLISRLASDRAGDEPVYLAGGAIRDLLSGSAITDLDLVVKAGAAELALALAHDALIHERFGTAELEVDGTRIDIATARQETYPHPGCLPEVSFAATIEDDLARRDFSINAMAVSLAEPDRLIDPLGGLNDLGRGVLRVLHEKSFIDDPTRALRAARYAARFGFDLDPGTADLLADVDLKSVSSERVRHELELISAESTGVEAFRLISVWGLIDIGPERLETARIAVELLYTDIWRGRETRSGVVLEALFANTPELPVETPALPSTGYELARRLTAAELVVNRALGVEWLDTYEEEWSVVQLSITGDDLVLAGLLQGPAIGVGLAAALEARLDRGVTAIDDELRIAVEAADAAAAGEPE